MAQHPNSVRFDEVRRVLEDYGWELNRIAGSHHTFVRRADAFTVPLRRPVVLPVYVRQVLRLTEADAAADAQAAEKSEIDTPNDADQEE